MKVLTPSFIASGVLIIGAVLCAFIYFRRRRKARVMIDITSNKFMLPTQCAESLQSYKIGSVLMSLPETPEGRALESVSRAEHYTRIKLTNGMRETIDSSSLSLSFAPLYIEIRRRDDLAILEEPTPTIELGAIGPRESVHVDLWHVAGIYRKNIKKSIKFRARQNLATTYRIFLDTDFEAYYLWRVGKTGVFVLLFVLVICEIVIAAYWSFVLLS